MTNVFLEETRVQSTPFELENYSSIQKRRTPKSLKCCRCDVVSCERQEIECHDNSTT